MPFEVVSTTVLWGVAVPDTICVPTGCVELLAGLRMAIVGGGTVVKPIGVDITPPGPLAVTVSVLRPVGNVASGPQLYVPDALAVVAHNVTVPGPTGFGPVMVITLPGVATPAMVGVVLVETFTGEVTVKLGGPATVKFVTAAVEVPPALPATAVSVFGPAANEPGNVAV